MTALSEIFPPIWPDLEWIVAPDKYLNLIKNGYAYPPKMTLSDGRLIVNHYNYTKEGQILNELQNTLTGAEIRGLTQHIQGTYVHTYENGEIEAVNMDMVYVQRDSLKLKFKDIDMVGVFINTDHPDIKKLPSDVPRQVKEVYKRSYGIAFHRTRKNVYPSAMDIAFKAYQEWEKEHNDT